MPKNFAFYELSQLMLLLFFGRQGSGPFVCVCVDKSPKEGVFGSLLNWTLDSKTNGQNS